jgi:cysteinyl-tRNA synthetase
MSLRVYNTLSGHKEAFEPLVPGKVGMYVCGVTVYDYCHIGHARANIVFDIVYRYLQYSGYDVTYVRNYTDVDDKIINRANERGISSQQLAEEFIQAFDEDMKALGLRKPTFEPKATAYIDQIIALAEELIGKGMAYEAAGDVYFSVAEFPAYLKLSKRNMEEMQAGARITPGEQKRNPMDFALWKAAKPGEPSWDSPWGPGRPGWHIECSAMSEHYLSEHFDIHGGGQDLQFPHHENEIAQSEAATGETFVNYWIHNGFVQIDEEKMSKSLGNFFTVREVLKRYRPEEVRFFILGSHYRSPLNYTEENLDKARGGLTRLYTALRGLPAAEAGQSLDSFVDRFHAAMDDDFNTPEAIAVLFELANALNRARADNADSVSSLSATLRQLGGSLGLLAADAETYLRAGSLNEDVISDAAIEQLVAKRNAARDSKDWVESDRIREQLNARGVVLEDGPAGTSWRRG